jgi:hypothetical protein
LPQRGELTGSEQIVDGDSSAQLFASSSTAAVEWEEPTQLLVDPGTPAEAAKEEQSVQPPQPGGPAVRVLPAIPVHPAEPAAPPQSADPRRRAAPRRLIAVVTPTVSESREYAAAISASDEKVRALVQKLGRIGMLRTFLGTKDGTSGELAAGELQQAIDSDLAALKLREAEFNAGLQAALSERADLRSRLEEQLKQRARPLQALGRNPEADGPASVSL